MVIQVLLVKTLHNKTNVVCIVALKDIFGRKTENLEMNVLYIIFSIPL